MRTLTVGPDVWRSLLASAHGGSAGAGGPDAADPALAVYAPLARRRGVPFVMAQIGQSLDGRVATPSGDARDISGADGLAHLHRLRALADVVVVGVGTAIADDPRLTVRLVEGPDPVRAVIDPNGRLPADRRLLRDGAARTLLIQGADVPVRDGFETVQLPRHGGGLDPRAIVAALAERGLSNVLLEGGAVTIGRFVAAGALDRLHVAVAPLLIGSGPAGFRLAPVDRLDQALRPPAAVYQLGSDILFDCDLRAG
jgi:diaminohydroxyphosphoribosylaminopyrimidine deaminase/5-amino-6-(5-phosphoribosylamino)uracil reductase